MSWYRLPSKANQDCRSNTISENGSSGTAMSALLRRAIYRCRLSLPFCARLACSAYVIRRGNLAERRWLFSCDRSLANTHVYLPLPFKPHGTRSPIPLPVFGHTHLSRMIENHSERESIRAFFSSLDSSSVSSGPIECSFLSFSPKTLENRFNAYSSPEGPLLKPSHI